MRKVIKILLLLILFYFINICIFDVFNIDIKKVGLDCVSSLSDSDNSNTILIELIKFILSLSETFFALVSGYFIDKRKKVNETVPYLKISVIDVSGIRKNDNENGITKIKLNSEKNIDFIYIYASATNSGNKKIYDCYINNTKVCKNVLSPGMESSFVFCVYKSRLSILNCYNLIKIRYSDENDTKYIGYYLLNSKFKRRQATLNVILKQRRV